jgi:hypothetical protein
MPGSQDGLAWCAVSAARVSCSKKAMQRQALTCVCVRPRMCGGPALDLRCLSSQGCCSRSVSEALRSGSRTRAALMKAVAPSDSSAG